jgi:Ca-activated chloride channel family protein
MRRTLTAALVVCALTGCQTTLDAPPPQGKFEAKPAPPVARAPEPAPVVVASAPSPVAAKARSANKAPEEGALGSARVVAPAFGSEGLGLQGAGMGGGGIGDAVGLGGLGTRGRGGGLGAMGTGSGGYDRVTSTEDYGAPTINAWTLTQADHLSTFSVDVDTASYTLARAKLVSGQLPPADSVRVEEWLNYFRYSYPQPETGVPLSVTMDAAPSPFTPNKHLLRVGVQGRAVDLAERQPSHLTFLVDVSGSMQSPERLPLAKRALRLLVDQLHDGDTVALVTYAGNVRLVLPHTGMNQKARIHEAIEALSAGGSTAMGSGVELAYQQAVKVLDSKSSSRVIILSDGDANVGRTSHDEILKLVAGHVKEGVTLTTVGFGMGNYKAVLMEQLADKGNGNHFYVDSLLAAKRIFVEQLGGTLEVIAQDVKLQVDFDPAQVNAYRLVGYENRDIADRDFRNDRVDAGEIGSGHTVTALYELDLKSNAGAGLATVRVRAKAPRGTTADEKAFMFPGTALATRFADASADFRFATAVMGAAEIFRRSPSAAEWSYDDVRRIAAGATPAGNAEREEFLSLLERAQSLARRVAVR